jgi:hypothetical protein
MTKWDDFSHFIVNDLSFHGDVTLAHSYIVHLSFFETWYCMSLLDVMLLIIVCVVFCRSMFVLASLYFLSLYNLSLLDLWLIIIHLATSIVSYYLCLWERTEMILRQNGTYPWSLWNICSVMVNQVMVATVNL